MGKKDPEKNKKVFSKFKKKKKHRSSSISSSSSSSLSSIDEETKRKLKKKLKKLRKKEKLNKKKKVKKTLKKLIKSKLLEESNITKTTSNSKKVGTSRDVDSSLIEKSKSLAPMTKEEWEKQQNTFKRVFDEETGRMRLVKGTGEIVEECVSRERHLAINKQATKGDGEFFQKKLMQQIM